MYPAVLAVFGLQVGMSGIDRPGLTNTCTLIYFSCRLFCKRVNIRYCHYFIVQFGNYLTVWRRTGGYRGVCGGYFHLSANIRGTRIYDLKNTCSGWLSTDKTISRNEKRSTNILFRILARQYFFYFIFQFW